jgi:hypothetical protein
VSLDLFTDRHTCHLHEQRRGPAKPAAAARQQKSVRSKASFGAAIEKGGKNDKGSQRKQTARQKLGDKTPRSATNIVKSGTCKCIVDFRVSVVREPVADSGLSHSVLFNVRFPHRRAHDHDLGTPENLAVCRKTPLVAAQHFAEEMLLPRGGVCVRQALERANDATKRLRTVQGFADVDFSDTSIFLSPQTGKHACTCA